ncbi:MAG: polyprenyl synthetase family protein [Lachnospiraceae bacterium]|nr:polyprenyl synthetase family protein [Lachnospiraceae bacterium]
MNFDEELKDKIRYIEEVLGAYLPKEEGYQKTVIEAMNYSVLAGGKRLRPMLMAETYAMFGGAGKIVEPFMAAMEMIHNYSLVHDDLPAMDNDEYRRGRKTTHAVYGEGMAVLAGDGLLNYAFETACKAFEMAENYEEYKKAAAALSVLSKKAGIYGMIGGQCADIEAEDNQENVTKELLLFIHEHKTAALIQSAMMIGAILAGADKKQVDELEKCAYNIGVAFQIQDDILDVTGSIEVLGKPIGSDEKNNKITYVTIHGVEKSKEKVAEMSNEAIAILKSFPKRNLFLEKLAEQLIYREK